VTRLTCCIVPPYVLEHIILHADEVSGASAAEVRRDVLDCVQVVDTLRSARVARAEALSRGAAPRSRRHDIRARRRMNARLQRRIFDSHRSPNLPGNLARSEGQPPTGDVEIDRAYDNVGATFDLLWREYRRNSIDGWGGPVQASIRYRRRFDNAAWDGRRSIFGEGDGRFFHPFSNCLDVTAHELIHGVTEHEANLVYWGQSGALNESISDVFGSLVKQRSLDQTADQADWTIGDGLMTPRVRGWHGHPAVLRSLKAPGTAFHDPVLGRDRQPASMRDYVWTMKDNGGVHINSGIPNHAFYLASTEIGGRAWEKAGLIWYKALVSPALRRNAQFRDFARITARVAGRLFGARSLEHQAVADAWSQVLS
jgi:Zn-dependent metalloprotease